MVRNSQRDLKVFIKRTSEYQNVPYREIKIDKLGSISPLKQTTKDPNEDDEFISHEDE